MTPPAPNASGKVLLIGDPLLRRIAAPVGDVHDPGFLEDAALLQRALADFRAQHGFGRAIAAPQLGLDRRMIAVNLGQGPFLVLNPEITWRSDETFTLWDDCMSFPFLLVRVRRHRSISLRYIDAQGVTRTWDKPDLATSELLQHEIDHLDGILATDRALDREAIVSREVFERMPEHFRAQVDYVIATARPTSPAA